MKDTINIRICTGTTCYVMGASDLLTLEEHIPSHLRYQIKISGSTCLGLCRHPSGETRTLPPRKPPFVEINGKTIEQATTEKVLEALEAEYAGAEYAYYK